MSEKEFSKAAALFAEKKYHEAIQHYGRTASANDISTEVKARALSNISACYACIGDFGKALDSAMEAVTLQPTNAKTLGRVATAYEGLQHYEESSAYYEKAINQDPQNMTYTSSLARVRGLIQSKRGLASAGTKQQYYYAKSLEKGKEAMAAKNYLEAIRHFGKALDLLPSSSTAEEKAILFANRSAAFFRCGRIEESADDALMATQENPTYARGFFRLACAKNKLKKYCDAHAALERCLHLDSVHTEAKALMEEIEPHVLRQKQTAQERAKMEAQRIAELKERHKEEASAQVTAVVMGQHSAHSLSYAYCTYCNESGHMRAECPLRRHKRARLS